MNEYDPVDDRARVPGLNHARLMKIRSRWLNWLVAASVVFTGRLLFRTLRIQYLEATDNTNPYSNDGSEGFIYCVWHDAIAFPCSPVGMYERSLW